MEFDDGDHHRSVLLKYWFTILGMWVYHSHHPPKQDPGNPMTCGWRYFISLTGPMEPKRSTNKIQGPLYHGSHWEFCPNSFQIDSIKSCCTSKKLEFWLKIVKIIYFVTLKPIKGTLGFILEIMKKIARWRHKSEISKRNVKTMISPLLFRLYRWLGCQKKQYDPLKFS